MDRKVLEGIKPFNDFFFKSCYYHQLISGLSLFGIHKDNILLNYLTTIKKGFLTEKEAIFSEKVLAKLLGFKSKIYKFNEKTLIKNISRGNPLIVGVDCYYLESRVSTYLKSHDPHYILVYGYDKVARQAFVVDHDYRNSIDYAEKVIDLDNLLLANRMLSKNKVYGLFSSKALIKKKSNKEIRLLDYIPRQVFVQNLENSIDNIAKLKQWIIEDVNKIKELEDRLTQYMFDLKTWNICLSKCEQIDNKEIAFYLSDIANAYSNILTVFWKMKTQNNYQYIFDRREAVFRKLQQIVELEDKVCNYFLEGQNGLF